MSSIAPFHVCLCVKSETAAVLVVTQHSLLNHMQGVRGEVKREDVSDPDMLKAVQTAVSVNRSVKRIRIEDRLLKWTNVATAIIEGAAHNTTLMEVELVTPKHHPPPQEVMTEQDKQIQNYDWLLRLVSKHHMTSHDIA